MKHFFVIAGGDIDDAFACHMIKVQKPDGMIAADKGMDFFYRNKIKPDFIIGDFDSADSESLSYFKGQSEIQIKKLLPEKNDTDTEAAVRLAISLGAEQITLLGVTGSRLDHVLGNIELLGIGLKERIPIALLDAHNRIQMIDKGITIAKSEQHGKYVSLLPYTDKVSHLTLRGFKYPLLDASLESFCTLGISNEIVEEEAEIIFESGILLVVESKDCETKMVR